MIDRPNTCDIVRPGVSGVSSFLNRSDHTNFFHFSHVLFLVLFVFVSFPNETLFFFRLRKGKSSPISFLLFRSRTRPTKKKRGKDERSRFHYYYPIPHPPYKKKERRELVMKNSKTKKKTDSTYSI